MPSAERKMEKRLGRKVEVNAIAPGLIRTDFAKLLWEGGRGDLVGYIYPLKRLGEPEVVSD